MKSGWRVAIIIAVASVDCVAVTAGGSIAGTYAGQGVLQMTITSPSYRELPQERTNSYVTVGTPSGGRLLVNVRFNPNGNQCTLNAAEVGDGFVIDPGQVCRGLMAYDQYDLDAVLRVSEARGTVSGSLLTLVVQGAVDAEHRDGSHNLGLARWTLQAAR